MSESAAISTVVTSLKTVRDQYQEQLQNIPQYATFLRVQQLTEISPAALGIAAGTDGFSTAHDVVAALGFARDKFKEHLTTVPEYRALLAINKLIADLDEVQPEAEAPVAEAPVAEAATAEAAVAETASTSEVESLPEATAVASEQPAPETAPLTGVLGHHDSYDSAVDEALADIHSLSGLATSETASETEAVALETPTVQTSVGGVAFESYPNAIQTGEQTAAETPPENPGAERAA